MDVPRAQAGGRLELTTGTELVVDDIYEGALISLATIDDPLVLERG